MIMIHNFVEDKHIIFILILLIFASLLKLEQVLPEYFNGF